MNCEQARHKLHVRGFAYRRRPAAANVCKTGAYSDFVTSSSTYRVGPQFSHICNRKVELSLYDDTKHLSSVT
jgi:hypothetical protein